MTHDKSSNPRTPGSLNRVCSPLGAAALGIAVLALISMILAMPVSRPVAEASPHIGGRQVGAADISVIQHIVFIIKENRTYDNYFGTFPGADGATRGTISTGQEIPLGHTPDRPPRDIGHGWDQA